MVSPFLGFGPFPIGGPDPPRSGSDLDSQPTLSRLENTVAEADAEAINTVLLDIFCDIPRKTSRQIVLDLDTSAHTTHGQQSFACFNDHYGTTCYLPLFLFARVRGEAEEYLIRAELLDHHGQDEEALVESVQQVVRSLRKRWPDVRVTLRADAWFSLPDLYDWCDQNGVGYAIAIAANSVLKKKSQAVREAVEARAQAAETGEACRYGKIRYQAGSWKKERCVIVKATSRASRCQRREEEHEQGAPGRVDAQVIGNHDRPPPPSLRSGHRPCQLFGKRRGRSPGSQLVVEPALPPVDQAKAIDLAIVAGSFHSSLACASPPRPHSGQGRVQRQLHFILQVEVGLRQPGKQLGEIGRRLVPMGVRHQRLQGGRLGRRRPGQQSLHPQAFPR
jgi:hypothetical protein